MLKDIMDEPKRFIGKVLRQNKKHLRQAKKTPFAKKRWRRKLGINGRGEYIERILKGVENYKKEEGYISEYMKGLASGEIRGLDGVDLEVTLEEYRKFWRQKRGSTAKSPFGLHIRHFKAALTDEDLLDIHRWLITVTLKYGFVTERWKLTLQLMLEKDAGTPSGT